MSKQAFAKGMWEAEGPFVRTPLIANERGGCDGGFMVAAIHPNVEGGDAVARLMAAAPELFGTLKQIVIECTESPNCDAARLEVILSYARAALAKAVTP